MRASSHRNPSDSRQEGQKRQRTDPAETAASAVPETLTLADPPAFAAERTSGSEQPAHSVVSNEAFDISDPATVKHLGSEMSTPTRGGPPAPGPHPPTNHQHPQHAQHPHQHRGGVVGVGDKDELSRNFPVDDIVQHPLPGYVSPSAIAFSPDDQMISYLFSEEGTLTRKLYAYDLKTCQQKLLVAPPGGGVDESNLSTEEKLRRERQRERGLGITRYDWSKNVAVPRIMIPLPDGVYVQDGMGAELRLRIPGGTAPIVDPQVSPDGGSIAFVRDGELFVVSTSSGEPRQLTFGAKEAGKVHGLAEYIAQEEMERRSGFWWSPDSSLIAFTETDASAVPLFRIPHSTRPPVGPDSEEEHAYPFAGQANVSVRLGVVPVAGGEVRWMDLHCGLGGINPDQKKRRSSKGSSASGGDKEVNPVIAGRTGEGASAAGDSSEGQPLAAALGDGETSPLEQQQGAGVSSSALGGIAAATATATASTSIGNGNEAKENNAMENEEEGEEDEEYLARVSWLPDGRLSAQVQNRRQTCLKLLRFCPSSGLRELLLTESSPLWVNLHDCFTPLVKSGGELRGGFLWASERTGFRHLYLYAGSGRCVGAVTGGDWMVEQIAGVDETGGLVYFSGTADGPLESHLYAARLFVGDGQVGGSLGGGDAAGDSCLGRGAAVVRVDGTGVEEQQQQGAAMAVEQAQGGSSSPLPASTLPVHPTAEAIAARESAGVAPSLPADSPSPSPAAAPATLQQPASLLSTLPSSSPLPPRPTRLTQGAGRHVVVVDHSLQRFVDLHDSLDSPPSVRLCCLATGRVLATIFQQQSPNPRVQRLQLKPPELVEVTAADGTVLHGAIYRPDPAVFGPPPYRTVVSVYGGPHVQTVSHSWLSTVDMRAQFLRTRGLLVWKLDNRGSSRRGLAFEGAIKCNMGGIDADDQAAGVRWLIQQGLADPSRIGIYGWSYGGYLSAMCLARYPSLFRCAIAGAPVTAWDGYDTHYTERYMGLPAEQASAYDRSAVMRHVGGIRGQLLLVHGMIDENVHFRHTVRLVQALTTAAKPYELLLFPEERHMPRGLRDRTYMEERIYEFLNKHFL